MIRDKGFPYKRDDLSFPIKEMSLMIRGEGFPYKRGEGFPYKRDVL